MVNKHDHVECEHEVRYCKKCDVCYCAKCGREWPAYTSSWTYTWPNSNIQIYPTSPTLCNHTSFSSIGG